MEICEIFGNTVQGEGPYIGRPAIFIRTAHCVSPYCEMCDSKYSWGDGKNMSVKQILKEIQKYKQNLVVITGGEPYIQKDIYELIKALMYRGYSVQTETSGKVDIKTDGCEEIVCSPKQYNGRFVIKQSAIDYSNYFKFVVGTQEEMDNVLRFLKKNKIIYKDDVYLMPKGATREEQIAIMPQIVKWCIKYNLKISPRLHVLIWDNRRGV